MRQRDWWQEGCRILMAGSLASLVYLAEMALDMRLLRYPQNDLMLQGRMLPITGRWWPLAGLMMHISFGTFLAGLYTLALKPRLPGPPWLRGALFALAENTLLWPLVTLVDRYHPAVRDGQMPPMGTLRCFVQAMLRHLAFGAALGAIEARPRR